MFCCEHASTVCHFVGKLLLMILITVVFSVEIVQEGNEASVQTNSWQT